MKKINLFLWVKICSRNFVKKIVVFCIAEVYKALETIFDIKVKELDIFEK